MGYGLSPQTEERHDETEGRTGESETDRASAIWPSALPESGSGSGDRVATDQTARWISV